MKAAVPQLIPPRLGAKLRTSPNANWGWVLALGIVLTVAGFVCMMDPWVSVAAMGVTVGVVFLLEGVSAIFYGCISRTKL